MKLVQRPLAAVLALVGALALLAAGCGGGQEAEQVAGPLSAKALSRSAQTSASETSARFTFDMVMSAPGLGDELGFTGEGSFDSTAERASLSFDMSSFAQLLGSSLGGLGGGGTLPDFSDPEAWKIDAVQDGQVVFMRFPLIASQLPDGKSWVKIDAAEAARLQGFDLDQLQQFTNNDPRDMLKFLEAVAGEIEMIGTDEVRGVSTTHYRTAIDLRRYAQLFPPAQRKQAASMFDSLVEQTGLGAIPVDVWLDSEQRVRKLELYMSATDPGTAQSFEATIAMEIFDYGQADTVELPPAGEVVDIAEIVPTR